MEKLAYIFDGTFEGLMCCVFRSYTKKEIPAEIATEECHQIAFGQESCMIKTNPDDALRVARGIKKKAGGEVFGNVEKVFLSCNQERFIIAFRYIRLAFECGSTVLTMLAHPDVVPVTDITVNMWFEAHSYQGKLRFSLMKNGVYFARISPKNNILPLIMGHFVDRYNDQPFVIYDYSNNLAGIYDCSRWNIFETNELNLPEEAENEDQWVELWRGFFGAVQIAQRYNPKLQMKFCPKRYWRDMVEMQPEIKPKTKKKAEYYKQNTATTKLLAKE